MMIVPLLGFVDITSEGGITKSINTTITVAFDILGLQKNLLTILFLYIFLISFREVLTKMQRLLCAKIQHSTVQTLRNRLYSSICHAEWIFLVKTRSSDFSHTLTVDINRLGHGANMLIQFISTAIMLGLYIIIAAGLSFTMTMLTLFCGSVVLVLLKNKTLSSRHTGKIETGLGRKLHSVIMEHLNSMKLAKVFLCRKKKH